MKFSKTSGLSSIGVFDGAVWYHGTVSIPGKWYGMELVLEPGPVDNRYDTLNNRQLIGECVESGLQTGKVGLKIFRIAGDDKVFKVAVTTISGNSLSVNDSGVKNPVAVRYLWKMIPKPVF